MEVWSSHQSEEYYARLTFMHNKCIYVAKKITHYIDRWCLFNGFSCYLKNASNRRFGKRRIVMHKMIRNLCTVPILLIFEQVVLRIFRAFYAQWYVCGL